MFSKQNQVSVSPHGKYIPGDPTVHHILVESCLLRVRGNHDPLLTNRICKKWWGAAHVMCSLLWQNIRDFSDVIEATNQLILKKEVFLDYLGNVSIVPQALKKRGGKKRRNEVKVEAERRKKGCWPAIAGFEKLSVHFQEGNRTLFSSCEEMIWTNNPSIISLKADSFSGSLEGKAALPTPWLACKNLRQQLDTPHCTWTSDFTELLIVN